MVDVRGHAVDLVVGGHHAAHVRLLDRGLEGHQETLADDALADVGGCGVGAALRLRMHGEVLGGGHHVMAVDEKRIALQALDGGHPHARDQVGVLAIGLFRAAPARVARDAQHRRKHLIGAARAGLVANRRKDALHQRRIPRAGQSQRLRKAGAAVLHVAVQRLAQKHRRNAQPRLLAQVALHSVAQNGGTARREFDLRAPLFGQSLARRLTGVGAGGVDHVDIPIPPAGQLIHLLLQRHARQQVGDAVLDGKAGVLVARRAGLRGRLFLSAGSRRPQHQAHQDSTGNAKEHIAF